MIIIIMSLIKEAQQTCAFTFPVMKIQDNVYAMSTIRIYRLKISNQSSQINIYLKTRDPRIVQSFKRQTTVQN